MRLLMISGIWYTLFPKLLNMTLTASVVILFVLIARMLLQRAPKVFSYALWAVVLFRLLCPVTVSADFSLLGLFDVPTEQSGDRTNTVEYIPPDIVYTEYPEVNIPIPGVSEQINAELPQGREQLAADPLEAPVSMFTYIWLTGILGMTAYSAVSFIDLRKKLAGAMPVGGNLYLADHIASPFVMGLFRPKIYLPSTLSGREQEYIILHERYHIRRLDHVVKFLWFAALCLHWFNPLVWAAFILSGKDMEMSCDEAVVRRLGADVRADYAASLLSLATGHRIIAGMPLAFGEGDPKGRIKNLSRWKKPAVWIIVIAAVFCVFLAISLFTNPNRYVPQICAGGVVYEQEGASVTELPAGSYQLGMLGSILHRTTDLPEKELSGVNLDEKYAGCPIYLSGDSPDTIYLEDYAGFYLPFIAVETQPFGYTWRVDEVVYDNPSTSFSYTAQTAPLYTLDTDHHLYVSEDVRNQTESLWQYPTGQLEEITLSSRNFDQLFQGVGGHGWIEGKELAASLRENNVRAWQVKGDALADSVAQKLFYYLLVQEDGEVYLAAGYHAEEGNPADSDWIRWLFRLEKNTETLSNVGNGVETFIRLMDEALSAKKYRTEQWNNRELSEWYQTYNGEELQIVDKGYSGSGVTGFQGIVYYRAGSEESLDDIVVKMLSAIMDTLMTESDDRDFVVIDYEFPVQQLRSWDSVVMEIAEKCWADYQSDSDETALDQKTYIDEWLYGRVLNDVYAVPDDMWYFIPQGYYCFEGTDVFSFDQLHRMTQSDRPDMTHFFYQGSAESQWIFLLMKYGDVYRLQRITKLTET